MDSGGQVRALLQASALILADEAPDMADASIADLSKALGHGFEHDGWLREALTHPSLEGEGNYQRLEFLGDRVLGLIIAARLLAAFPNEDEGTLARRFNALVRKKTLAGIAREAGLAPHIRMSHGEEESGGREKFGILADTCEAVIAALYLDGGLAAAETFVDRYWGGLIADQGTVPVDAKSALQEWAAARGMAPPEYQVVAREGPDHAPLFTLEVGLDGVGRAQGRGRSKQTAEQAAAAKLLARCRGQVAGPGDGDDA